MPDLDMGFVRRYPDKCCAEVTRGGDLQPCDKPAHAIAIDDERYCWPVCIHHARGRTLVSVAALLELANQEAAR